MSRYLLLIFLSVLNACSHRPILELSGFDHYVKKFESMSVMYGNPVVVRDLKVRFGDTKQKGESVVGLCYQYEKSTPVIVINEEFWADASEDMRDSLFFHEMGHCILNQDHRTSLRSIMNPYIVNDLYYRETYYMTELFTFGLPEYSFFVKEQGLVNPYIYQGPELESNCDHEHIKDGVVQFIKLEYN